MKNPWKRLYPTLRPGLFLFCTIAAMPLASSGADGPLPAPATTGVSSTAKAGSPDRRENGNPDGIALAAAAPDMEGGTAASITNPSTEDMFGTRGGYLHPFFSLKEEYTDNLYNIDVDQVENFLTVAAPGIWIGLPRLTEKPAGLEPHNAAVGGVRFSSPASGAFNRFQTYLLGALEYNTFSAASDLNYTAWHLEGMYQQNLPVGLSFRAQDRYTHDQDRFDMGSFLPRDFTVQSGEVQVEETPSLIRPYSSNQAVLSADYALGDRFSVLASFINFSLNYDRAVDDWLDRTDNSLGLTLSYRYSPKTSFFVEYDHAYLSYAENSADDSQNTFVYGGVNWLASDKTSLMAKGGYQLKQYDLAANEDAGTFTMEVQLNYLITDKTKLGCNLYKALEETDSIVNRGMDTTAARLRYDQRLTDRIQGYVEVGYEQNDYADLAQAGADFLPGAARRDNRYLLRPGIQYTFREWLVSELSYSYEDRNSSDDLYDYATQTLFLSLNLAF